MNKPIKIAGSILILVFLMLVLMWAGRQYFTETDFLQDKLVSVAPAVSPIEKIDEGIVTTNPTSTPSEAVEEFTIRPNEPISSPSPAKTGQSEPESAVVPAKPSYDTLKSEPDAQILALRGKAQSELLNLVLAYQTAEDNKKKAALKAKGSSMMAGYDGEFAAILNDLKTDLQKYEYDTAIISTYKQQYNQEKQLAQAVHRHIICRQKGRISPLGMAV